MGLRFFHDLQRKPCAGSRQIPDSGNPPFAESLSDDLLDYAHTVMALALRLRGLSRESPVLERAFLVASDALGVPVVQARWSPDAQVATCSACSCPRGDRIRVQVPSSAEDILATNGFVAVP